MRFFTTFSQRKILRYYWEKNVPFVVSDLLKCKVLRSRMLGYFTLSFMEYLGQVLPYDIANGEVRYIGTTDSKAEWDSIRKGPGQLGIWIAEDFGMSGLNRYERQEILAALEKMLDEFKRKKLLDEMD